MQVFICYSRTDKQFAAQLVDDLINYDLNVWMDVRSIPTGANWDAEVQKGLSQSDVMLVLLSPASAASQNVADEWSFFIEKQKPIIPIMVIPCEAPFRLSRRQRVDFTTDYAQGLQDLLKAVGSPAPHDPDSTQKARPARLFNRSAANAANGAATQPRSSLKAMTATPDVGIKTYPVIWSGSYHWFTGLGSQALQGSAMISRQELKLVPRTKPIISIPLRSLVSATIQRSIDNHMKLTYYGPDGSFQSLVLMGGPKGQRKSITEDVLNLLKLLTGRTLS